MPIQVIILNCIVLHNTKIVNSFKTMHVVLPHTQPTRVSPESAPQELANNQRAGYELQLGAVVSEYWRESEKVTFLVCTTNFCSNEAFKRHIVFQEVVWMFQFAPFAKRKLCALFKNCVGMPQGRVGKLSNMGQSAFDASEG